MAEGASVTALEAATELTKVWAGSAQRTPEQIASAFAVIYNAVHRCRHGSKAIDRADTAAAVTELGKQ